MFSVSIKTDYWPEIGQFTCTDFDIVITQPKNIFCIQIKLDIEDKIKQTFVPNEQ